MSFGDARYSEGLITLNCRKFLVFFPKKRPLFGDIHNLEVSVKGFNVITTYKEGIIINSAI